jgi:hypothetical protein
MIVSGERLQHNGVVKINQSKTAIDAHAAIMGSCGIVHVQPLKYIDHQDEIHEILSRASIRPSDVYHYRCVFSRSYQSISGEVVPSKAAIERLYVEYLLPLAIEVVESVKEQKVKSMEEDLLAMAESILRQRIRQ